MEIDIRLDELELVERLRRNLIDKIHPSLQVILRLNENTLKSLMRIIPRALRIIQATASSSSFSSNFIVMVCLSSWLLGAIICRGVVIQEWFLFAIFTK
jgi:hypothetical protein